MHLCIDRCWASSAGDREPALRQLSDFAASFVLRDRERLPRDPLYCRMSNGRDRWGKVR